MAAVKGRQAGCTGIEWLTVCFIAAGPAAAGVCGPVRPKLEAAC
jgi:hypothetical protein